MIKEQELKNKCTPEFIKWMCEYAEGFFINGYMLVEYQEEIYDFDTAISKDKIFLLLIRRAVEGIKIIYSDPEKLWYNNIYGMQCFRFKNYQPEYLTQAECAMLDCLLEIFAEQEGRDE